MLRRVPIDNVAEVTGGSAPEIGMFIPFEDQLPDGEPFNPWRTLPRVAGNDHVALHVQAVRDDDIDNHRGGVIEQIGLEAEGLGLIMPTLQTYINENGLDALVDEDGPYASYTELVELAQGHVAFKENHNQLATEIMGENAITLAFEVGPVEIDHAPEGDLTYQAGTLFVAALTGLQFVPAPGGNGVTVTRYDQRERQEFGEDVEAASIIFAIDTTGEGETHYSYENEDEPGVFSSFVRMGREIDPEIARDNELRELDLLGAASQKLFGNLSAVSSELADAEGGV